MDIKVIAFSPVFTVFRMSRERGQWKPNEEDSIETNLGR